MYNAPAPAAALALVLACGLAVSPLEARAQSSNRYLNAAMKLYADLEYESALDNLKKAREKGGLTDEEDVQSSLYMGLILFELGSVADAQSAFKAALALKCDLALPRAVSPKAVALFEKSRKDIWKGAPCPVAAQPKPQAEPTPAPTDAPRNTTVLAVHQPEPTSVVESAPAKSSGLLGVAVGVPLIAIGAGLLGGGGYFGLQSQDYVKLMQSPTTWQNDPINHQDVPTYHRKANEAATNANILFGVGAAVVVVGVVTMVAILAGSSGEAPSTTGSEMPGR